ncbi:hypothetical protein [Halorussus halobius]|uniref:hypothetical protein n=1 Tax=Halorussus halobius TaxID=1710537 RepID=UPI001FCF1ED4|nr:hypothetical protein [Halorussus halobius]
MGENDTFGMIVGLFSALLIVLVLLPAATGTIGDVPEKRTVVDSDGVVYNVSFSEEESTVSVGTYNPTRWDNEITGYSIRIDGQRVQNTNFRLDKNERRTEEINITPGINVNQDNHTVEFSTYGNSTQFNFTRKINSSSSGDVPTLYISDVEVTTGTIDGEPSAVANVTLVNPSRQLYSTKLMVHTVGTDGSLYPASVRPESSRTITVELLDDREAEIAGEARLYTGNMTTEEGAMDQVEFAGETEGETQVWNTSYDPVRPTWMNDNYEYHNDSYSRGLGERLSGGREVEGVPIAYPVAALVVGWFAVRRIR